MVDNNSYNEGGIPQCETDSAVEKLHTNMYIADRKHKFYDAAQISNSWWWAFI